MPERLTQKQDDLLEDFLMFSRVLKSELILLTKEEVLDLPKDQRTSLLTQQYTELVRRQVIDRCLYIELMLELLIKSYIFQNINPPGSKKARILKTYINYSMERLYLINKLEIIQEIFSVPKEVLRFISELNNLRNAFAHSFFPDLRNRNKPVYKKRSIVSMSVFGEFLTDAGACQTFLQKKLDRIKD